MKSKATEIIGHLLEPDFDIEVAIAEVENLKKSYQTAHDDENANIAWAVLQILEIHRDYRTVFIQLRNKQYYEAWCLLEQIEIAIANLLRNCPGSKNAVKYVGIMVQRLQSLYPYKVFFSTVIVIKERVCSICGKKRTLRNHCGHFVGHVYGGELCSDIVQKCELGGVDVVFNPEHKYAVAFVGGENGREDHYDYSILEAVMNEWDDPYKPWYYETRHIFKSPDDFPGLKDEDYCPCGSAKKYAECCKKRSEGIKHTVYEFKAGLEPDS